MSERTEETFSVKIIRDVESGIPVLQEWFNARGNPDNPCGPAVVKYHATSGEPILQEWIVDGAYHRPESDGPAIVSYEPETGISTQQFWLNDQLHRDNGPAIIIKNERTGQVLQQRFFKHGRRHLPGDRLDPQP